MKLAVIGDIHGFWGEVDTRFFNQSDYDGLLFTGDLPRVTNSLAVAKQLSRLTKPAWLIPGNHDAVTLQQLLAEIKHQPWLCRLTAVGMSYRVKKLARALEPVQLVGYSLHPLEEGLALLASKPHSMGGNRIYFQRYMRQQFGVATFSDSLKRLKVLVDQAPERLIFLAHNGPAGLGDTPDTPFGNDFNPALSGDFGDPDLQAAIEYARVSGRQVLVVIAGHMHHRNPKTRACRQTWAEQHGVFYLNAARVPRIRRDGSHRHHVRLAIQGSSVAVETVYVSQVGTIDTVESLQ